MSVQTLFSYPVVGQDDLTDIVNQAKEAQSLQPSDDFFAEDLEDDMALSQTLTQTTVFRRYGMRFIKTAYFLLSIVGMLSG